MIPAWGRAGVGGVNSDSSMWQSGGGGVNSDSSMGQSGGGGG